MRLWLSKLPEALGWEDVINAMMSAHGERGGQHARTALENMLCSSDEDMLNKIADAVEHIGQEVCVHCFKFGLILDDNSFFFLFVLFTCIAVDTFFRIHQLFLCFSY